MRSLLLLCALLGFALPAQAVRPTIDLRCISRGIGPTLECTMQMRRIGQPMRRVELVLSAHMPSMPMAHNVLPVTAKPTGRLGEYRAALELEMHGDWAIQLDLRAPVRDRVVKRVRVEACPGKPACPARILY